MSENRRNVARKDLKQKMWYGKSRMRGLKLKPSVFVNEEISTLLQIGNVILAPMLLALM